MAISQTDVSDFFAQEGQRISKNINQKHKTKVSPFLSIVPKEFWDDEIGEAPKTFKWNRAKTAEDEKDWEDIDMDNDSVQANGGACIPPADEIEFSQEHLAYNLQHKAMWGPRVCINNLRSKFAMLKQMEATVKALADESRYQWVKRNRDEYKRLAGNKVVVSVDGIDFDGEVPNDWDETVIGIAASSYDSDYSKYSRLTNDVTDFCYEYLNHQGAQEGSLGMSSGTAIYGLITSARQSRALIKEDPDAREDFRYSGQNEKLLEAMGVKYTYNGFTHLINDHPARFNLAADLNADPISASISSGVLTFTDDVEDVYRNSEIILYNKTTNTTVIGKYRVTSQVPGNEKTQFNVVNSDGTAAGDTSDRGWLVWKAVPEFLNGLANPKWLTATFEDSYVFHQNMMTCLVPKPISSVGKAKFDPVDYSGDFRWTNYPHATDNPDGTMGRFRGVLSSGSRPDNTEFGIVLRHLSCAGKLNDLANCDGASAA